MHSLIRRAAVAAGAVIMVLGAGVEVAAASAGPVLAFTPAPYGFGQVPAGQTAAKTFTLANTGSRATGVLRVTMPGSAEFTITADTCAGARLRPGKSCAVTVQFAPASSGTVTATLTAVSRRPRATATDSLTGTSGHLYWTNFIDGTIQRVNPDGTSPQTLISGQTAPEGVAVDNSHIFWADEASGTTPGAIREANLDGTGVTTLITGQIGQFDPAAMAVANSHIYWGDLDAQTIMRANLDGTGVTTLVTGQRSPFGVAVNSSHIYWSNGASGTIMEANLDGTGVITLITGAVEPTGVAVDASHIYWADFGAGTIMAANLDGTGVTTLVTGQDGPGGVAVDSGHIYWTDQDASSAGTIMEANLNGTGVTTLVTGQHDPSGVAVGLH